MRRSPMIAEDARSMDPESRPLLSVVVPAHDEEGRIERGIRTLMEGLRADGADAEVLIVDDGSTDRTPAIVESLVAQHDGISGLRLERNRGKGAAVRAGMLAARGQYRLFSDVDQSTSIAEWRGLLSALSRGYDVAIASREIVGARRLRSRWHRRQMGNVFRLLRDLFVVEGFIDTQCGFKLFTAEAAERIFSRAVLDRFCFDVELLTIAVHLGMRVIEVPVTWTDDAASKVNPVLDSLSMLKDLWRIRRNRSRGLYD